MKKIFVQLSTSVFERNAIFEKMDINHLNAGWFEMKRRFEEFGYDLVTADDRSLNDCEGIIFFNANSLCLPTPLTRRVGNGIRRFLGRKTIPTYPTRQLYEEAIAAGLRDKLVLVLWEPKTVLRSNFDSKIWSKFNHILTWDDDLLRYQKFSRFVIPMEGNKTLEQPVPFKEKKLLVNASFNKYSSYKNELYVARRQTSAYFTRHYPADFDLFGLRWNEPVTFWQKLFPFLTPHFSTYRGRAADKLTTFSKYKFNLCYENTSDAKGYVCDKIFTSFHARSVPVYWGASNIEEYIDPATFVDRRKFRSDAELARFLVNVTETEYNAYLQAADRFMQSAKYAEFSPENFATPFLKVLGLNKSLS